MDVKRTRQKKLWKEITEILEAYERKKKDQKEQDLAADKRVLDFLQEKEVNSLVIVLQDKICFHMFLIRLYCYFHFV